MDPQKIEVEVRPRDVFKHYVHIQRPGDILQWSFYTKKKNVAFGLYYLYLSSQHPAHLANSGENITAEHGEPHELGEEMSLSCEFVHEVFNQSTSLVHIDPAPGNPPPVPAGTAAGSKLRRNSHENLPQNDLTTLRIPSPLGELIEILPIEKYPTFETTIRGSLDAPITGTYVLVFDNSFSINTSKHLIFTVDIISNNRALRPLASSAESLRVLSVTWCLPAGSSRKNGEKSKDGAGAGFHWKSEECLSTTGSATAHARVQWCSPTAHLPKSLSAG